MIDDHYESLNEFFSEQLRALNCHEDTRSYIIGALSKYQHNEFDLSGVSLTLLYIEAQSKMDFETFQNLGDFVFMSASIFPNSLNAASPDYYYALGSNSYLRCYKLINKQWKVYRTLAEDFIPLVSKVNQLIVQKS